MALCIPGKKKSEEVWCLGSELPALGISRWVHKNKEIKKEIGKFIFTFNGVGWLQANLQYFLRMSPLLWNHPLRPHPLSPPLPSLYVETAFVLSSVCIIITHDLNYQFNFSLFIYRWYSLIQTYKYIISGPTLGRVGEEAAPACRCSLWSGTQGALTDSSTELAI